MSIVHGLLPGASVLDLCAGSGALGLEALSRGARHATFVESDERVVRTLRDNIATLGAESQTTIVRTDAIRFVSKLDAGAYELAFADPPYADDTAEEIVQRWLDVPFADALGVEHSSRTTLPGAIDTRRYGDSAITFYRVATSAE